MNVNYGDGLDFTRFPISATHRPSNGADGFEDIRRCASQGIAHVTSIRKPAAVCAFRIEVKCGLQVKGQLCEKLNVIDCRNSQVRIPMVGTLEVGKSLGVANDKSLLISNL